MGSEESLWSLVPIADFQVPLCQTADAARGTMRRLRESLQGLFRARSEVPPNQKVQRHCPNADVLHTLSPALDWAAAAASLAETLGEEWFADPEPGRSVTTIVGPPGCDIAQMLQTLARDRGLTVLAAPCFQTLLESSPTSLPAFSPLEAQIDRIVVIPQLERWYLRHEDGMAVIRQLLRQIRGSEQRILIGCDSWAWAFLQQAIGIQDMLGPPLTLAPFDAERLDTWCRSIPHVRSCDIRTSDDGEAVFPDCPTADEQHTDDSRRSISAFIRNLSAHARGNPAVAMALWRFSLEQPESDAGEAEDTSEGTRTLMRATPPAQLPLPRLTDASDRIDRIILHSVLLHGGMPAARLSELLPFSETEVERRTNLMCRTDVLQQVQGRLHVSLTAYPGVRQDLRNDGFLTDAF
ncbi:MAG: hypothetical protein RIK87_27105 [Fuerstiella sp.]